MQFGESSTTTTRRNEAREVPEYRRPLARLSSRALPLACSLAGLYGECPTVPLTALIAAALLQPGRDVILRSVAAAAVSNASGATNEI